MECTDEANHFYKLNKMDSCCWKLQGAGYKINMQSQVPLPTIFIDCVKEYSNAWFLRWVRLKLLHSSSRCNFFEMYHLSTNRAFHLGPRAVNSTKRGKAFCDLCHSVGQLPNQGLSGLCQTVSLENFPKTLAPSCCDPNTRTYLVFVFPFPQTTKDWMLIYLSIKSFLPTSEWHSS